MSNKKLVTVFIVVFAIIVLTIYVFVSVRFSTKEKTISKVESNEIKNRIKNINRVEQNKISSKYSSTVYSDKFLNLTYEERDVADERIDYILELINSRKLEDLYSIMDENYKKVRFKEFKEFSNYFNDIFHEDTTYSSSGYELNETSFLINIVNSQTNEKISIVRTTPILLSATESLNMSFGDYLGIDLAKYVYSDDKIRMEGNQLINYSDGTSIVPLIYNKTDKEVSISFEDLSMIMVKDGQNEKSYNIKKNTVVVVPPKEYKSCEVVFENFNKVPKHIIFNINEDGEEITKDVYFALVELYEN